MEDFIKIFNEKAQDCKEPLYGIVGTYLLTEVVFWTVGGLYLYSDITGKPNWMKRFKTQPDKNQPPESSAIRRAVGVALANQIFLGFPMAVLTYMLQRWRGCDLTLNAPSPSTLLHHPLFYKTIHKIHHEWTAPVAIAAVYAHPVEYIFSNIVPLVLGPLMCASCLLTTWIWYSLAVVFTINHHSGYHLPYYPSNEFHDYHHLKFTENFGVVGLMDWIHGTDIKYRKSKQYKRDKIIFSASEKNVS